MIPWAAATREHHRWKVRISVRLAPVIHSRGVLRPENIIVSARLAKDKTPRRFAAHAIFCFLDEIYHVSTVWTG